MIKQHSQFGRYFTGFLVFCIWAALQIQAQQRGGTGGGRGGGGFTGGGFGGGGGQGGGRGSTSGSANRDYAPNGTVGEAMITVDPETKKVIVITDDETSQYIAQVINNLDRPQPQVLIKVVFLEVTYTKGLDFGVEGNYRKGFDSSTSGTFSNIFGLAQSGGNPIPPGAGIYQVLGSDYQATLRAIATAGKTEVLSRPSILARNNQQATISLGQEVPLISNTRFDAVNGQINTVTYRNVGIILRVTPFIRSDGMVEMIVSPETSSLADRSQWVPISSGPGGTISQPVINSRSADTVVVVPNGQTVIIGGLMENSKTEADSKIPVLGDIPWLGNLFKHKSRDGRKTELIIFLTPQVVNEPSQLAGLTANEKADAVLAPKAFTEKELDRFIDGLPSKDKGESGKEPDASSKSIKPRR